jgi:hypothetical protein
MAKKNNSFFIFILSSFLHLGFLAYGKTNETCPVPADLVCLLGLPLLIKRALLKQKQMTNENRYK